MRIDGLLFIDLPGSQESIQNGEGQDEETTWWGEPLPPEIRSTSTNFGALSPEVGSTSTNFNPLPSEFTSSTSTNFMMMDPNDRARSAMGDGFGFGTGDMMAIAGDEVEKGESAAVSKLIHDIMVNGDDVAMGDMNDEDGGTQVVGKGQEKAIGHDIKSSGRRSRLDKATVSATQNDIETQFKTASVERVNSIELAGDGLGSGGESKGIKSPIGSPTIPGALDISGEEIFAGKDFFFCNNDDICNMNCTLNVIIVF